MENGNVVGTFENENKLSSVLDLDKKKLTLSRIVLAVDEFHLKEITKLSDERSKNSTSSKLKEIMLSGRYLGIYLLKNVE